MTAGWRMVRARSASRSAANRATANQPSARSNLPEATASAYSIAILSRVEARSFTLQISARNEARWSPSP